MVMSSISRRIRRSGANPTLNQGRDWGWWDSRSKTGTRVNDESALGVSAYFRGIKLISETIAGLPLHVYEKQADGTNVESQTPETAYLWLRPNIEMTRQSLWEHVIADEVRGNGFIWVDKNRFGDPLAIWYIDRRRVQVGRASSGQKVYLVDNELAMIDFKDGGEIVHIPNWGNGLVGYDLVKVMKEAIALGLTAEEYASKFFSEDGVPPGILTTDQTLNKAESDRIAKSWSEQAARHEWRRIRVLSNGAKFQQTALDPEEAQMSEVRGFQGEEVARFLGIPPHMLGFTEKVTSWGAGIAEQKNGFLVFTLQSHINRHEQAVNDALLVRELTRRYMKLDTGGLLRGTTLQRYQAYALGYARWLTPNDIRRDEDLPPLEGGDILPAASNLIPIDQMGMNMLDAPGDPPPRAQLAEPMGTHALMLNEGQAHGEELARNLGRAFGSALQAALAESGGAFAEGLSIVDASLQELRGEQQALVSGLGYGFRGMIDAVREVAVATEEQGERLVQAIGDSVQEAEPPIDLLRSEIVERDELGRVLKLREYYRQGAKTWENDKVIERDGNGAFKSWRKA
jgi:HK97 family phage portal protein